MMTKPLMCVNRPMSWHAMRRLQDALATIPVVQKPLAESHKPSPQKPADDSDDEDNV
jgi:hypothetical protein